MKTVNANETTTVKTSDAELKNTNKEITPQELVKEVADNDNLQQVKKATSNRDWIAVATSGALATIMTTADMITTNIMQRKINGEDADQYTALDIAGVAVTTGLVASAVRTAVDFIPGVKQSMMGNEVATSISGNVAYVASSYFRDGILNGIKGKLSSTDVEVLAEEA